MTRPPNPMTEEYKQVWREVMEEFWDSETRDEFSGFMKIRWARFQGNARWSVLRQRLSDAARRNGRHS